MKKILTLTGGGIGVLFSIWDALVSDADSAPLHHEFSISMASWPFFITKTIVYLLIGAVTGWLTGFMVDKGRKKR